jgi:hypothetical protein
MPNPYAQVALTYIRRPFSSWLVGLGSIFFVCVFIALALSCCCSARSCG